MYLNKCIKCGREFETKNPKRVICPDCLYPDKSMMINGSPSSDDEQPKNPQEEAGNEAPRYYSAGGDDERQQNYQRPQNRYNNNNNNRGGYNQQRPQNNRYNNNRGGYNQQRPQNNRFNNNRNNQQRPQNGRFPNKKRPMAPKKPPKQLLVSKEQLTQIEFLYKMMLPLPNPDAHEVIAEKIGIEPRKVFFGINLVRQKMMLPKLPFPKRKLAITPDQLFAIKNLYTLLLPVPPIGCHKMIAAQLKMDEWRVHVGIGLIRAQMGLPRWNEDRTDVPEALIEKTRISNELKAQKEAEKLAKKQENEKAKAAVEASSDDSEAETEDEKPKAKRGRKPKTDA